MDLILDTDIGSDIDDAYALALILRSRLDLLGVSTVSGDTVARARVVEKMVAVAGKSSVPVFAGVRSKGKLSYGSWAQNSRGTSIVADTGAMVDFYWKQIEAHEPGTLWIAGIGPLSNIAIVRARDPAQFDGKVNLLIMGGSIHKGYLSMNAPTPEYNILKDRKAAKALFSSGVSMTIGPLDTTADLKLEGENMARIETTAENDPLAKALVDMTALFHRTPILFDPGTVALLIDPSIGKTTPLFLSVNRVGMTRIIKKPKPKDVQKQVCLEFDKARFYNVFLDTILSS
jgi:inosine-uridine nucleoside N-ribohydrolase